MHNGEAVGKSLLKDEISLIMGAPSLEDYLLSGTAKSPQQLTTTQMTRQQPQMEEIYPLQTLVSMLSLRKLIVPSRYPDVCLVEFVESLEDLDNFDDLASVVPKLVRVDAASTSGWLPDEVSASSDDDTASISSACENIFVDGGADEYGNNQDDTCVIEVAPGVTKQLRGTQDTYKALAQGYCTEATCIMCNIQLLCIQDCECVLCPQCLSISPVECHTFTSTISLPSGGVCLGILIE